MYESQYRGIDSETCSEQAHHLLMLENTNLPCAHYDQHLPVYVVLADAAFSIGRFFIVGR